MLKKIILLTLISSSILATPTAQDLKFVTNFKGFTCKSFSDKVQAPVELANLGAKLVNLGISDSTRRAIMDISINNGECLYSAEFSRKKGEKILNFETSYISGSESCLSVADELDEIMKPGFRYIIKFNAFLALLFGYDLTSQCDNSTGNNIAEFHWEI